MLFDGFFDPTHIFVDSGKDGVTFDGYAPGRPPADGTVHVPLLTNLAHERSTAVSLAPRLRFGEVESIPCTKHVFCNGWTGV